MKMMNFCPYDGKTIDLNDLAYEIIHPAGWDYDRVKRETVVGTESRLYVSENDSRRSEYQNFKIGKKQVILLAGNKYRENGLTLLRKSLDKKTVTIGIAGRGSGYTSVGSGNYADFVANLYGIAPKTDDNKIHTYSDKEEEKVEQISYEYVDNRHTFLLESTKEPVMYALPCCPYCHNRLPLGWEKADDFIGLSLVGPSGVGKTAFLYSLIHDGGDILRGVKCFQDRKVSIKPACYPDDENDILAHQFSLDAKDMCKKKGKAPKKTENHYKNTPFFFQVTYGDDLLSKSMIVGIYDYAGNALDSMKPLRYPDMEVFHRRMYADICFFDPEDMPVFDEAIECSDGSVRFTRCSMMTLEEQARFQRENKGKVISAANLLKKKMLPTSEKMTPALAFYKKLVKVRQDYGGIGSIRNMRFVGVISKADFIRNHDKVLFDEKYEPVFENVAEEEKADLCTVAERKNRMEELAEEYHLFGERELRAVCRDYGRGYSFHVVSALGCRTDSEKRLMGSYHPLNVAEPVLSCVVNRIVENRWR